MQKNLRRIYNKMLFTKAMIPIYIKYLKNSIYRFGMTNKTYRNEYKKYIKLNRHNGLNHYDQMLDFFQTDIKLYSNTMNDNPDLPTIIVVVKDELERIKLFFEHYRKLGVQQFIVIDNNSLDGTREYAAKQINVRVYLVKQEFKTERKVAWIEKVLALTGYNRWYIVVDSDELIDYIGSENHSVSELIKKESKNGKICLQGYMVDMYSKKPVFSDNCSFEEIPKVFSFFDKDSYFEDSSKRIYGGPRFRVFGLKNQLSKQAIFYFKPNMLYLSCHKMYMPESKLYDGRSFVLRHYKFLIKDKKSYAERVNKQNFYNGSIEYKTVMKRINSVEELSFIYDNSAHYESSQSLKQLPFLKSVDWGK